MYFLASERWEHGHSPCLRIQRTHVEGRLDASEMFACSGFPAGRKPASPELAGSERQAGHHALPGSELHRCKAECGTSLFVLCLHVNQFVAGFRRSPFTLVDQKQRAVTEQKALIFTPL